MKKRVIIGAVNSAVIDFLKQIDYDVVIAENNKKVLPQLANHVDLSILRINEQTFAIDEYNKNIIELLKYEGYNILKIKMQDNALYPYDCMLNHCIISDKIICNIKSLDKTLKALYEDNSLEIINVNQGYVGCSTIVLNNSLITDDESIYKVAIKNHIESILVSKGSVSLEGFDYGFIGGASFVDDENKSVVFFGNIRLHNDYKKIKEFITSKGFTINYISDFPLTDYGGAVII